MLNDSLSIKFEQITGQKFTTFYSTHKPKLVWYLTKYTKDQELSEDFADDAFTQALLKIENYNSDKSQVHTWVYKIAENLVKKDFKDRKRMNIVSMDKENDENLNLSTLISNELLDDDSKIEDDLIILKKAEIVKEAIHRLPEKYKTVMILRELENKAYLDIANLCIKNQEINIDNETINLESASDFLNLEISNNGNLNSYINITYNQNNSNEIIQFEIKPNKIFNINRDDIENVLNIEIISNGNLKIDYSTTTNLSTIKSQISKGRQLIQSMVNKKFKILDENGII